jgi:elongator complex protein 6
MRITAALSTSPNAILILDRPDIALLTTNTKPSALLTTIYTWRAHAHATIISLSADIIPEDSSAATSPLLVEQQRVVLSLTHQANVVVSTKRLDSGTAKDVAGVVRITPRTGELVEREVLFCVESGSGRGASVWERGGLRV